MEADDIDRRYEETMAILRDTQRINRQTAVLIGASCVAWIATIVCLIFA